VGKEGAIFLDRHSATKTAVTRGAMRGQATGKGRRSEGGGGEGCRKEKNDLSYLRKKRTARSPFLFRAEEKKSTGRKKKLINL